MRSTVDIIVGTTAILFGTMFVLVAWREPCRVGARTTIVCGVAGIAAGGLLLFAGIAHAQSITVTDAKRIADAAWPASRCAGRLQVIGTTDLAAPGRDGAYIHDGSCRILVRPGLPWDRRCDVIVHEAGHAAGLALATPRADGSWEDRHPASGVMAASGGVWPACHPPARVESVRVEIRENVRALLPAPGPWVVRCGPTRSSVTRCTARRPRTAVRRLRVVTHHRVFAITQTMPVRWVASADRITG